MYSYISGTLEEVYQDTVVVDNQGIGYNIQVPLRLIEALPPVGSRIRIYTYLAVREDAFSLFGFETRDELNLFKMLINVSGIGPKGGLAILSVLSPDELRFAIIAEDDKKIAKAPGVGKKTAQRMIIELKDKIDLSDIGGGEDSSVPAAAVGSTSIRGEAAEALTALGYSASDAAQVLRDIEITEDMDTEALLKEALKRMSFL